MCLSCTVSLHLTARHLPHGSPVDEVVHAAQVDHAHAVQISEHLHGFRVMGLFHNGDERASAAAGQANVGNRLAIVKEENESHTHTHTHKCPKLQEKYSQVLAPPTVPNCLSKIILLREIISGILLIGVTEHVDIERDRTLLNMEDASKRPVTREQFSLLYI